MMRYKPAQTACAVGVIFLLGCFAAFGQDVAPPPKNDLPPIKNLVPDKNTAIAIANAVLIPIYGRKQIEFESPLSASQDGDTWIVEGKVPAGWLGTAAVVVLSRDDGRIISIRHTK